MYECVRFTAINWECFRHKDIFVSSSINGCTYNHQLLENRTISRHHHHHNSNDENRSWAFIAIGIHRPGFVLKTVGKIVLCCQKTFSSSGPVSRSAIFWSSTLIATFGIKFNFFNYFFFKLCGWRTYIRVHVCARYFNRQKKITKNILALIFTNRTKKEKNNDYEKFDTHVNAIVHVKTLHQIPNRTPQEMVSNQSQIFDKPEKRIIRQSVKMNLMSIIKWLCVQFSYLKKMSRTGCTRCHATLLNDQCELWVFANKIFKFHFDTMFASCDLTHSILMSNHWKSSKSTFFSPVRNRKMSCAHSANVTFLRTNCMRNFIDIQCN